MEPAPCVRHANVVIVGAEADPHVAAVLRSLGSGRDDVVVVDAATLAQSSFRMDDEGLAIGLPEGYVSIDGPGRGWVRRFAPDRWYHGLVVGSKDAAIKTSWLALLAAAMRTGHVEWLTQPDRVVITEDKMWQRKVALNLGIPVPPTVVASSADELARALGEPFIVKPLGPAEFVARGDLNAVFTTELTASHPAASALQGAPFIAQRKLRAERHLRVVTVANNAWVCSLDAPACVDWRCSTNSHTAFVEVLEPSVSAMAAALADAMAVGYSSQDWIVEEGTAFFVDLNPAGQWLFLPSRVGGEIAEALGEWLSKAPHE